VHYYGLTFLRNRPVALLHDVNFQARGRGQVSTGLGYSNGKKYGTSGQHGHQKQVLFQGILLTQ
jgi:hypothetical protein